MDKAERERAVFEAFAQVAPFTVMPNSIENKDPPEPDIVCHIEGNGVVGFELTELIDELYMARLDLMNKTRQYLNSYWQGELSPEQSALFRDKYCDALLHFEFAQDSTLGQRKDAGRKAFSKLVCLANRPEGCFLKRDSAVWPTLKWVNISRVGGAQPLIDVSLIVWLGDPTNRAITKKLAKKYECEYSVELLAHINWGIMPHEEVWKASAKMAATQISRSCFRKMWVFDCSDNEIKFESEDERASL